MIMVALLLVPRDRPVRRWGALVGGLGLYGFSAGLMLQAGLGVDPWDVLHQGLARTFGGSVGTWVIVMSGVVLVLWVPLQARPGAGTVANSVLIGLAVDATLDLVPAPRLLPVRAALLIAGVTLNAIATGLYIGAGLGPGPRDGLTLALARRGHSIPSVRTTIELVVLVGGWRLGGTVGVGTLLYALSIGPLTHLTIPRFAVAGAGPGPGRGEDHGSGPRRG